MKVVPRDDVWVTCPSCCERVYVTKGTAICTNCSWTRTGAYPGYWCGCCGEWTHETLRPATDHIADVKVRCGTCGRRESLRVAVRNSQMRMPPCRCGGQRIRMNWAPVIEVAAGVDALFGLPFYFSTSCSGYNLWVANHEHLEYLENFIAASVRPRGRLELGNVLPKWMLDRKNRDSVLRGLETLRKHMEKSTARSGS